MSSSFPTSYLRSFVSIFRLYAKIFAKQGLLDTYSINKTFLRSCQAMRGKTHFVSSYYGTNLYIFFFLT